MLDSFIGPAPENTFTEQQARPVIVVDGNAEDKQALRVQINFLYGETPVLTFNSGAELLDFAPRSASAPPQLILVDVATEPARDVISRLRADPQIGGAPIIVMSDREHSDAAMQALNAGAQAYLPKPVSRRDFLDILHGRAGPASEMELS
ncbi:MAG TPA: response regulator [Patescibacteria group bacterium]|nr:response regulator [Patescibacteria group bacterium]